MFSHETTDLNTKTGIQVHKMENRRAGRRRRGYSFEETAKDRSRSPIHRQRDKAVDRNDKEPLDRGTTVSGDKRHILNDYGRYATRRASRGSIIESVSSEDVLSSSSDTKGNVEHFEKMLCKEFNRDVIRSPVITIPYKVWYRLPIYSILV